MMKSLIKPALKREKDKGLSDYYAGLRNFIKGYELSKLKLFLTNMTHGALLERVESNIRNAI